MRDSRRPRRYGSDHTYRSRSCVDKVRELDARYLVRVGDGTHYRTDSQTVEIVVDEDEHAEEERRYHRAGFRLDILFSPSAECARAARLVYQRDEDAEKHKEDEYSRGVRDGRDKSVLDDELRRRDGIVIRHQRSADDNADEQGRINLFCDKREHDRDDRRYKRYECLGIIAFRRDDSRSLAVLAYRLIDDARSVAGMTYVRFARTHKNAAQDKRNDKGEDRNQRDQFFLVHKALLKKQKP